MILFEINFVLVFGAIPQYSLDSLLALALIIMIAFFKGGGKGKGFSLLISGLFKVLEKLVVGIGKLIAGFFKAFFKVLFKVLEETFKFLAVVVEQFFTKILIPFFQWIISLFK